MAEIITNPKADYEFGLMVGQRVNRRGSPELRPESAWFWRGYLDSASWISWQDQYTTGRYWPRLCIRGSAAIQIPLQRFLTAWTSAHRREKAIHRLETATAKLDHMEAFNGEAARAIIHALYKQLPEEKWMKTPERISKEIQKALEWNSKLRKTPREMPRWHFDDLSVQKILDDSDTLAYVRDTYVAAATPELIYEAGYRSAQGTSKKSASPERGALRSCPDFCDPIAEIHKKNPLFWRGWADRGWGFWRNSPFGPMTIPMTLGCAMALWEFFDDPLMYNDPAPGFATRTLTKPFAGVRRLYLEPEFDDSICFATPSHRRELANAARKSLEQM